MARRRRLDPDEVIPGQLDLLDLADQLPHHPHREEARMIDTPTPETEPAWWRFTPEFPAVLAESRLMTRDGDVLTVSRWRQRPNGPAVLVELFRGPGDDEPETFDLTAEEARELALMLTWQPAPGDDDQ